jgi:hypothetical protein
MTHHSRRKQAVKVGKPEHTPEQIYNSRVRDQLEDGIGYTVLLRIPTFLPGDQHGFEEVAPVGAKQDKTT